VAQSYTAHRLLVLQAALLLAFTRVALLVCSFGKVLNVASRLGASGRNACGLDAQDAVLRVTSAVETASRYVPLARNCLTRALVARFMLARRGRPADLRIGVAKDRTGLLTAHAWLEADGAPIFGATESELRQYALLPQLDRASL
jgi:hypothetical protein